MGLAGQEYSGPVKISGSAANSNVVSPNTVSLIAGRTRLLSGEEMRIESGDRKVSMEIVADNIVISSRGVNVMLFRGVQGLKSIPIHSITSVQVKLGTRFVPGYINLSYPGGKKFQGGLAAAISDPDTLIFDRMTNAEVQKFAAEIIRRRASLECLDGVQRARAPAGPPGKRPSLVIPTAAIEKAP